MGHGDSLGLGMGGLKIPAADAATQSGQFWFGEKESPAAPPKQA
jgi:hypothetical protein